MWRRTFIFSLLLMSLGLQTTTLQRALREIGDLMKSLLEEEVVGLLGRIGGMVNDANDSCKLNVAQKLITDPVIYYAGWCGQSSVQVRLETTNSHGAAGLLTCFIGFVSDRHKIYTRDR